MLSIRNVTLTKCNLYEMLLIQRVLYEMLPRQNVTIRKCTIQNVTDPSMGQVQWRTATIESIGVRIGSNGVRWSSKKLKWSPLESE